MKISNIPAINLVLTKKDTSNTIVASLANSIKNFFSHDRSTLTWVVVVIVGGSVASYLCYRILFAKNAPSTPDTIFSNFPNSYKLEDFKKFKTVESLSLASRLRENREKSVGYILNVLCYMDSLSCLDLSRNDLNDEELLKFTPPLSSLKNLNELNLSHNSITGEGALAFIKSLDEDATIKIDLRGNNISVISKESIEAAKPQKVSLSI